MKKQGKDARRCERRLYRSPNRRVVTPVAMHVNAFGDVPIVVKTDQDVQKVKKTDGNYGTYDNELDDNMRTEEKGHYSRLS